MVKAVYFDAGETLIHRNPSLVKITASILKSGGYRTDEKRLAAALEAAAGSMRAIVEKGVMSDSAKWDHYMRSVFRTLSIKDTPLMEKIKARLKSGTSFRPYREAFGVIKTINDLGIKTGVISNAPAELVNILTRAGLHGKFGHIIVSELAGFEKPDPRIFRMALKKAGVKSEEFVYVGDNYIADIKGGISAGVHAVWLRRETKHAQFSYADGADSSVPVIRNLRQLLPLMKKKGWL
jgi:putative hydrolase of the HAD superfamily